MREFFCILAAFSEGVPPRHCRAEHTVGSSDTRRSVRNETIQQGKSLHIEGAVHHRRRRGAHQSGFVAGADQQGEVLEEVVVTGMRGSLNASMETKRDAIGVVDCDQRRGHRQVPRHESFRSAAAYHRRLHRSPQRRGRDRDGARLRPAVQHGDAQRPADAGGRRVRQRAPTTGGVASATRAPSISPTSRPSRSARSRSTRPAVPTSPPAASARRSTCAPRARSTTTAWC